MTDLSRSVHIKTAASRLQVFCPWNAQFVDFAHRLGARWRKRTQMWSFKRHQYPDVAKQLNKIYGTEFKINNEREELDA